MFQQGNDETSQNIHLKAEFNGIDVELNLECLSENVSNEEKLIKLFHSCCFMQKMKLFNRLDDLCVQNQPFWCISGWCIPLYLQGGWIKSCRKKTQDNKLQYKSLHITSFLGHAGEFGLQ